jgi:glyceraldehyde-3-phosphate dehydrogenase (NADP+)
MRKPAMQAKTIINQTQVLLGYYNLIIKSCVIKGIYFMKNLFPDDKTLTPVEVNQSEYLINGELRTWKGDTHPVLSPICTNIDGEIKQKQIGYYPLLTKEEALNALESAVDAYDHGRGEWPLMSVSERIDHIKMFLNKMREKRDEVIKILMWEIGKSLNDSAKEFDRTVDYIIDTIEALKNLDRVSSRFTIENGIAAQIRRSPLGVTLCMGPYNYPLNETFTTLIPALIMGNTVVFKPAKFGALLHRPLLEAFRDSFPKGVINTIYGRGREVITPIMESGKINVLAFIGTSTAANNIKKSHPFPNRLRSVLGLEAKNAAIVLPDSDIDSTVKECVAGSLSYNGQRCTALKMLFVHTDIIDTFIEKFTAQVDNLKAGMPWDEGVNITPLPDMNTLEYMQDLVMDANEKGASVINRRGAETEGTLFFPAVVYPAKPDMKIYNEEQFGPVVPIIPFTNIDDPIEYIINSEYGQQVSLFGNDPDNLAHLIDPLVNQVCRVNINSQCQRGPDTFPFTGRKNSAEGTLSVSDALRVFSIRTLVAGKTTEQNKSILTDITKENRSKFLSTDFIF